MNPDPDRQRLLRMSLAGNAVFSVLSGLTFALRSSALASSIGLAPAWILLVVGIGLTGFAASVAWLASRSTIPLPGAMTIVYGDVAWVVGTVPLVMAGVLNGTGTIAALIIADVVLAFALLQYLGVRRIRRQGVAATAAVATS